MPCLEVTLPVVDDRTKEVLSSALTNAFVTSTQLDADIFGIQYCEYTSGAAAIGGHVWHEGGGRPYVHIILYCPRLPRSMKQRLVKSLTSAFTESVANREWQPVIHICEHPYDNVGVNGELLSDTYGELFERKFYYVLPND